ncbi:hypothetical protein CKAN_01852600 [Cinnamomum micranthum f. kanehirae]|uniref:Methyltransferase type 11 domain-containing protein n=1 Tax=Cinnamomum micranthum f. kanehirae TaxID=337451 RepID=A0A3S3MTI1_9MAGN|nr:hypothetical protein CKAN_01852600 [Cinnamomum micranthum f. kanehirae]
MRIGQADIPSMNESFRKELFRASPLSSLLFACRLQHNQIKHTPMALLCAPHTTLLISPLYSSSSSSSSSKAKAAATTTTMKRNTVVVRMTDVSTGERGNASVSAFEYEEGHLERPSWVGETPASRLVGALISFKPLFSLLKLGARRVLISTAERTKIPWREMATEILESEVYKEMESIQNPSLKYPDYYLNPFHAYDEGNLSWLAAAEAEAATMSMMRRAIPNASSLEEASQIVRGNWLRAIEQHHLQYSGDSGIRDILDIGCSVGVSTRLLADKFPSANVTIVIFSVRLLQGLDLSPYFLAVAQYKEKRKAPRTNPIRWIHANGEDTGLTSNSFDVVSLAFTIHECPARAIVGLVKEAFRLLRPGGTIALTDNSPKSKILQVKSLSLYFVSSLKSNCYPLTSLVVLRVIVDYLDSCVMCEEFRELSPVLFTLMKSTEPFLDEYYLLDLEGAMRQVGFESVKTTLTDPRHRTVTATVPLAS